MLDTGHKDRKDVRDMTDDGTIAKFQPDGVQMSACRPCMVSKAKKLQEQQYTYM